MIAVEIAMTAFAERAQYLTTMSTEQSPYEPSQLSFLAPEDVEMLTMMRRFIAEASRLYEVRSGRDLAEPYVIHRPADAFELLRTEMADLEREQLHTLNLGSRHQVISTSLVYQGTVKGVVVRTAEVFRPAIIANASGIVVAHNHPSGDPSPSPDDIRLTAQLHEAGKILDIELLDHIVIARDRFVSLRERGLGFQ